MRMQNLSRLEPKEIDFDSIDVADNRELILQNAIQIIDCFFEFYNPKKFLEDEHFFALSPMWVAKCDECRKNLQAKLEYIADSKFRKSFSGKMTIMREKIEAINDLIYEKTDEQIIKESVRVTINQLTEILWNLREKLREKL